MDTFDPSKLDLSAFNASLNPARDITKSIQRQQEESLRALENTRRSKEALEEKRHQELIAALKEAGEKGATIVIGDNANGIQIQQNTSNASQQMENSQGLDYDKAYAVLSDIKSYFEFPQFEQTFGNNTDNVKKIVEETMEAVKAGEDEGLIKKSFNLIKELAIGAGGSLIASGMLALIGQLPI